MKKILLIVITVVALQSCGESFLDVVPYSFTSPENFYKTQVDFELALNGCYDNINASSVQGLGNYDTWGRGLYFILNGTTDEMITQGTSVPVEYAQWGYGAYTTDNKFIKNNWFFFNAGINRCNYLLEKINAVEFKDEARKAEIKAEATFLRGLYHYYLTMLFGAIPVYTSSAQDPFADRNPLSEVYDRIITDFTYAYENLNDRATNKGGANKYTAAGYLAKVYTYLGSCKRNNVGESLNFPLNSFTWVDADEMYTNALEVLDDVYLNSGYKLIDRYDFNFRETTKTFQYQECLFLAEASSDPGMQKINIWLNNLTPQGNANVNGGGYGWQRPLGEVYNRYVSEDKRLNHNCTGNFSGTIGEEIIDGIKYFIPRSIPYANTGWLSCGKFRYRDPKQKSLPTWATDGNFPLLRYADILLLRAEALYYSNNETEARDMLTLVRQRSALTTVNDLNTSYYKSDFIQELLDERSRELCFEGHRRFDLMRFGKYTEVINALSEEKTTGWFNDQVPTLKLNWAEFKMWLPLPVSEVDLNPNLIQNPGWVN